MMAEEDHSEPITILVAEDSEVDQMLLHEAFAELGLKVHLIFVANGVELLEYLRGPAAATGGAAGKLPSIVLLDLNMPKMKGIDALKILRGDPVLCAMPVVVLSTSNNPKQIAQAYACGVNAYMTKPQRFNELVELIDRFSEFWLRGATLPGPIIQ